MGIGRLPADAWPLAQATGARIVPVQVAGRAELAYGAYHADGDALVEDLEAGLGPLTALVETLRRATSSAAKRTGWTRRHGRRFEAPARAS